MPISDPSSVITDDLLNTFRDAWMNSIQSDPRTDDPERVADRAGLEAVAAEMAGPWRTAQAIDSEVIVEATRLLNYALHLRMHGERAPGGNETWAQFDRECEHFLRAIRPNSAPACGYRPAHLAHEFVNVANDERDFDEEAWCYGVPEPAAAVTAPDVTEGGAGRG